jgi:alpha/beta hydrolase family protein
VGRRGRAVGLSVAVAVVLGTSACSSSGSGRASRASSTRVRVPSSTVAVPKVTGPITGGTRGIAVNAMPTDLAARYHYAEHEYFIEGDATEFVPSGTWGQDGRWNVTPAGKAHYKTRLIVRTPADARRFNGTVVVEWLNETSGRDADPDFGFAGPELMRDGFAYVGVSAQQLGVGGGAGLKLPIPGYNPQPLVQWDPTRYGTLVHPGDDYSYDIFSQAAQALWRPAGVNPLGALHPKRLIATGESQSAFRMVTYVDAIAPRAELYQGFVIHSRGGNGATINAGEESAAVPTVVHVRDDLRWPVMIVETETDLFGLGFYAARQPDTPRLRTWEMAGTAHADQSTLDYGIASGRTWDKTDPVPDFASLCGRINDGPQRYIIRAAFAALNKWMTDGAAPPLGQPLSVVAGKAIGRDARGNAIGGVRTPAVDVPVERLSGEFDAKKSVICSLFGSSTPFDAATLASLYPTHAGYVAKVTAAAAAAARGGFLRPADRDALIAAASAAPIPK